MQISRLLNRALAGLVGTVAMTTLMRPGLARMLPEEATPRTFLPRKIVGAGLEALGVRTPTSAPAEIGLSAVAHLGYGASMGAVLAALPGGPHLGRPVLQGAAFGLAVWAASYQGWIPLLRIQPATTQKPPPKWLVPIGSHLVFGITTAATLARPSASPERV
jgi:hypothetical protein